MNVMDLSALSLREAPLDGSEDRGQEIDTASSVQPVAGASPSQYDPQILRPYSKETWRRGSAGMTPGVTYKVNLQGRFRGASHQKVFDFFLACNSIARW